ncbi:isoform 2 of gamma-tubulin complex component 5 [Aspergillus udagawae]|uniref:Spindle pole body component n=1 Tax=Aspergillus udagawae TaxID=91492 RepID=A0A8H3NNB0_9EURO|nr:isoform 2 of gamma-tubulin complex component 5 [Aspergillus udagawae]
MTLPEEIGALTDELILAITKIDPTNTSRLKNLKHRVEDTFKSASHGRTDQFAVSKQLEGLQEKFQVLNKDDLADALRSRLTELDEHHSSWFPEILSFLLQLSARPAVFSRVDRLPKPKVDEDAKQLSWTELDASGSAYCGEDIWECVNFGADSSSEEDDDLVSSGRSDASIPQTLPSSPIASEEDYEIPDEVFSPGMDVVLVDSVREAQFWRPKKHAESNQVENFSCRVVTELQIVRETLFMLQGLPTSLFWRLDDSIEVDRRYTLIHTSTEALSSLLRSFSMIGAKVDVIRRFIKITQVVLYMQTFHRCVEDRLNQFDSFLSEVQTQCISQGATFSVSLLQLAEDVRSASAMLVLLADLISNLKYNTPDDGVRCLDLLYDVVCMKQATGDDDEFRFLADLFFSCLETYIRPIRRWMEEGRLDSKEGISFVIDRGGDKDLRSLWRGWYAVDDTVGLPQFMKPVAQKIFTAGKSMVFLQHLNALDIPEGSETNILTLERIYGGDSSSLLCLPFAAICGSAIDKLVEVNHSFACDLLRKELDQQCGLRKSLQALEHIYLCKDLSVSAIIDNKVFDLMDRGRGAWSDRYLLTELAQSAFSNMSFIDHSRIIVRSLQDPQGRSRSVNALRTISFDYVLPWPIANVIPKDAIQSYQRISTFLMQIRRAKHLIVKQRLKYTNETDEFSHDRSSNALSYSLRHHMLWFLNTLYSHITDFVISTATESLRKSLSATQDVDAMIAAHRAYLSSLEDQCLLSSNLSPLHQVTINLLDLCVYFADIQAARYGDKTLDQRTPTKYAKSSQSRNNLSRRKPRGRYTDNAIQSDDEDDDDDDTQDESDEDVGNTAGISFHEAPYAHRLRDIKGHFDQSLAFLTAGLKGVGRVDGQISWEILAEKLEWRKRRLAV